MSKNIAFKFALVGLVAIPLAACGGGSGSSDSAITPISAPIVPTASSTSLATASTSPIATSTATLMPQAKTGIAPFQVFDAMGSLRVTAQQAVADASRYGVVWGSRPGMPTSWRAGNAGILAAYYFPQQGDLSYTQWGAAGHDLAWWQSHHPDWVLYACTASGTPTKIPAYVGALTANIPLDIHNPAVVNYQINAAGNYALANGYNALSVDEVVFANVGGASAGSGAYGCGVYQNGAFVRRYSGKTDPRWTADTVAWVKAAHSIAKAKGLKLIVNHPAGNISNANEQAILANTDADVDETGYSDYGYYRTSSSLFMLTLNWVRYAQAHGSAPLVIDKFVQTTSLTPAQIEFSVATYLMGNQGSEGLFAGNSTGYGTEQYHSEYAVSYGTPCGDFYGGPATNANSPNLWYRRYSNAFVVVNSGSSRASESATLPSGHSYRDLEGRPVSNPLSVSNYDAYVLLTSNGCQ